MNKYFDIIPTPQHMEHSADFVFNPERHFLYGESSTRINYALSRLATSQGESSAQVRIYYPVSNAPEGVFTAEDIEIFNEKYADEQGYVIKSQDGITVLGAMGEMGVVYGIMTMLQLIGKPVGNFIIRDWPDFKVRGNKWTIWAETGIWSYDFGDGVEAIKNRFVRKLDMLQSYKINYVHADGFGFDADRFPEYAGIMRHLNDEARKRGIHIATGGYTMGYGMVGHLNSYQGKDFLNRKSYPDGEVYECMGTYSAWNLLPNNKADRSVRLTEVMARTRGTCISNHKLTQEKLKEIKDFVKRTHATALGTHNMDAHEMHPELWMARCENCRTKWPNDDIFARDGAAGAFAEFIDEILDGIRSVKDGDFDAERDTIVRMASPGYLYAELTNDEDFETGVKFWGKVVEYMKNPKNFVIGFREEFICQSSNTLRADIMTKYVKNRAMTGVGNFCGADGFYDDKLFAPTSALNYVMKGYSNVYSMNGNAFQEPLQVFNSEYLWNCNNSGFYNVEPKPETYEKFLKLYYDMIESRVAPVEIYGEGGFLDVICEKLYGVSYGREIAKIYKLRGANGEPPIACASNVDIYTNYTKVVYPMRWNNEMDKAEIGEKIVRFTECAKTTAQAHKILHDVLKSYNGDENTRNDLTWLCECLYMGSMLTERLRDYMGFYREVDESFRDITPIDETIIERLEKFQEKNAEFTDYVKDCEEGTIEKFGGSMVRRKEMADFLEYNTSLMIASIRENSRIPSNLRPERTREWW